VVEAACMFSWVSLELLLPTLCMYMQLCWLHVEILKTFECGKIGRCKIIVSSYMTRLW
jgi:hypothetical protein